MPDNLKDAADQLTSLVQSHMDDAELSHIEREQNVAAQPAPVWCTKTALDGIPILTVRLPWAALILLNLRNIENRSKSFSYRGRIGIHVSKSTPRNYYRAAQKFCDELGHQIPDQKYLEPFNGNIIGTVDCVGCVTNHDSEWFEGPYGLVLESPLWLDEPIPAKGKLGFWRFTQ